MRRVFRKYVRLGRRSPSGKHALAFGLRLGYWPCLKAPYVEIAWGKYRIALWYGLPQAT